MELASQKKKKNGKKIRKAGRGMDKPEEARARKDQPESWEAVRAALIRSP